MADGPIRVQLRRTKGWRMPPNTVVVARPTKWGNPFPWQMERGFQRTQREMRCDCVNRFRDRYTTNANYVLDARRVLAGKNLACWCPLDQPCHADVLLEIANG